jgi:4-hydroxythreonine-4-phosphate dehydrogenase
LSRPLLALSVGCPAGIGPEIALSAAARTSGAAVLVVGDEGLLRDVAARARLSARVVALAEATAARHLARGKIGLWQGSAPLSARVAPGKPNADAGAAQLAWIDQACDLVRSGACDALVTGPVSKRWIATGRTRAARRFRGHTEHLAARVGAEEVVMAFVGGALATALVTTHLPLRRVARAITAAGVATTCFWLAHLLARLGKAAPKIAVAGLNPHAGEGGLLGDEERVHIAPGIARARARLRRARLPAELSGPVGAETAYRLARDGHFDGVVAMYHDQATIAGKLLGFGELANVTLGLPIVRVSVDHGTAYDLAGTGRASDAGMRAALALAARLAQPASRPGPQPATRA